MRLGSLVILCAALGGTGACAGCGKPVTSAPPTVSALAPDAARGDGDGVAAATLVATVVALPDTGASPSVRVSIARTDREHQRGLMYVQNLPPDDGMLFIFDDDSERQFWMKNTLIPLDMIFIGADLTVVGVIANAKPLTTNPQTVGKGSRYVLEVNGGWASQHGVAAGTKMRFDNIPL